LASRASHSATNLTNIFDRVGVGSDFDGAQVRVLGRLEQELFSFRTLTARQPNGLRRLFHPRNLSKSDYRLARATLALEIDQSPTPGEFFISRSGDSQHVTRGRLMSKSITVGDGKGVASEQKTDAGAGEATGAGEGNGVSPSAKPQTPSMKDRLKQALGGILKNGTGGRPLPSNQR
jgi:hypothetical protein